MPRPATAAAPLGRPPMGALLSQTVAFLDDLRAEMEQDGLAGPAAKIGVAVEALHVAQQELHHAGPATPGPRRPR